jgi:hypothetical protein
MKSLCSQLIWVDSLSSRIERWRERERDGEREREMERERERWKEYKYIHLLTMLM